MKRTKRLLALALAGVLAGQMGVVAWGTGTPATTPTVEECKAKGHGSLQRVTAACTEKCIHWIDSRQVNGGGKGDDYYFVSAGDQITCDTEGKNSIVVDPSRFTAASGFLLVGFKTGTDKIYVLGKSAASLTNLSSAVNPSSSSPYVVTIDEKTITITGDPIASGDVEGKVGSIFTGLTLTTSGDANPGKNESRTITAKPTGGVGDVAYTWERYTGTTKDNFTYTGKEYSFTVSPDAAVGTVYTFKCTATDELGCSASAETTFTVTGCEYDISLGDISKVVDRSYTLNETKVIDLPSPPIEATPQQNTAGGCNIHTGIADHGYTADWSVATNNYGVTVSNNKLTIPIDKLPPDGTPCKFTLTATLRKNGVELKTSEVSFDVQRAACNVTPNPEITGTDSISEKSNSTVTYTLDWNFDDGKCTISHADPNHDYKVTDWNFKPDIPDYVTNIDSSNPGKAILHIDTQKLPTTPEKLMLIATITNNPTARTGDATVEKEITFQNNARATCDATPKSITLTLNNGLTEAKWDVAKEGNLKIIPFVATPVWDDNSCQDPNHLPNNHEAPQWSIDNPPSWLTINPANGELTANKATIPNPENKVAVRVTLGTGANAKTDTKELIITRPPKCDKKITKITRVTGETDITVEQGRSTTEIYYLVPDNLTYEGATCELGGDKHNKGLHNEVLTWKIESFTNESNVIDKENAFKIDENTGVLTVRGDKLKVGTYHVKLRISVKDSNVTLSPLCQVNIYCTTPDDDDDDSDHWESYEDKIEDAKRGSTVKIDLTGNGEVPFYVFESARGRDVTLQMKAGKNYTWTINGKAMKKWPAGQIYLPLEVETLKDKTLTRLCRDNDVRTFKLRHEGSFYGDMKLTVDVGVGNAKKTMYLYSYNEDKERLTYQSCALADNDGDVTFVMTRSLGAYAVTSKALYGEKPVSGGGGLVNGSGSGPTTVYPPVAPSVPGSSQSPSSSSSSSSGSESSSQSEPALPPEPPASSQEPAAPTDTDTKPKDSIPVLVPVLILAIAGVITATVLVVRSSRGRLDDFDD